VSAAITALDILNFIGCGLLPKGAAFRNKKQANVPIWTKQARGNQVRQIARFTVEELEELSATKKSSIDIYVSL
jgi:hypothetical protein